MSEQVSVLTPALADCPAFTANNLVTRVQIVNATGLPAILYGGHFQRPNFVNGDSFTVLSMGFFIPERFVLHDPVAGGVETSPSILCNLQAYRLTAGTYVNLPIGENGRFKMPFPNYEMNLGLFVSAPDVIGEAFRLEINFPYNTTMAWYMSMINLPAALHLQVFHIIPFVKVLHNFPLTV